MAERDRFRIREIQDKIRRVLMDEWDPIGIKNDPHCASEYDAYIGAIYGLIQRNVSERDLAAHLRSLEVDRLGRLPWLTDETRSKVASSLMRLFY